MTNDEKDEMFKQMNDLYSIFVLEGLINPKLSDVIDHVLAGKTDEDVFKGAWITCGMWLMMHAEAFKQMYDKIEELKKKQAEKN